MAKYNLSYDSESHITVSAGNIKIGATPQFNTLPSNETLRNKAGEELTNVVGTCGHLCECCKHSCYAIKSAKRFHNTVIPSWGKNTIILRENPQRVKEDIIAYVEKKQVKFFRFHTSGEWESVEHIKLYKEICDACPSTNFYIYTKAFDLMLDYLRQGGTFPKNLIINLSEWHGNINQFLEENDVEPEYKAVFESCNIFSYDDKAPECMVNTVKMPHCPAVRENGTETGVTCDKCRRCMTAGHKTAVYDH